MSAERRRGAGSGRVLAAVLTAAVITGACGGNEGTGTRATSPTTPGTPAAPTPVGTVTVSKSGCTLEGVGGSIAPGLVALTAVNRTDTRAMFDMWSITEGATYEQLAGHIEEERRLAEADLSGLGHLSFVGELIRVDLAPGESGALVGTVSPGTWGIVCIRRFEGAGLRPFALVGPVEVEQPSS